MSALAVELLSILKRSSPLVPAALRERLEGDPASPPVAEVLEVAERARRAGSSDEELGLALGALVALHAARSGVSGDP